MVDDAIRYALLATIVTIVWKVIYDHSPTSKLESIPTIGPSGLWTSYFGAIRTVLSYQAVVQKGYEKYRDGIFKIPLMDRWLVVLSSPQLISELSKAREQDLSADQATLEFFQTDYTMGTREIPIHESFHHDVVRQALTKNIGAKFHEVMEEIGLAWSEVIEQHKRPNSSEWSEFTALETMGKLACRVTNRYFFNAEICRNEEFADVSVDYSVQVFVASSMITMFPKFLRPIVGPLLSPFESAMRKAGKHVGPLIEERLQKEKQYGPDWDGKPNDLVSWLVDAAPEQFKTKRAITHRVISIHVASIHSSSNTLTQALFHIASDERCLESLRKEVAAATGKLGWTKEALDEMYYLDAFLRESQRFNGLINVIMHRIVMKPGGMTFSNGISIPQGTYLAIPERSIHMDENKFTDANTFKPERWLNADGSTKDPMVKIGVDCLNFGAGRHSCPGRFFAAAELKSMIAYVVHNYDIKLEDGTQKPPNMIFGSNILPNNKAKLLMKKRI